MCIYVYLEFAFKIRSTYNAKKKKFPLSFVEPVGLFRVLAIQGNTSQRNTESSRTLAYRRFSSSNYSFKKHQEEIIMYPLPLQ